MKNDKYYIPDIEDIYPGYKCEIYEQQSRKLIKDIAWHSITVDIQYNEEGESVAMNRLPQLLKNDKIRTRYLDRSDIEAEGWTMYIPAPHYGNKYFIELKVDGIKCRYILQTFDNNQAYVRITSMLLEQLPSLKELGNLGVGAAVMKYDGKLKSINELRKIQQWLGIK